MVNIIGKRVDIQPIGAAAPDNGLGQVFAQLGKIAGADTLTPALKREQLTKLADENEVRKAYVAATGADGMITDQRAGSIAAALGVIDPSKYGRMGALTATTTGGVDSPRAAQFLTGMGEYRATPLYGEREFANKTEMQRMQEATKLRIDDNKLVQVQGTDGPIYTRQGTAPGLSPVLSSDQVKAGVQQAELPGASPETRQRFAFGEPAQRTPRTYAANGQSFVTYDGVTNAQTGQPLPAGGAMVAVQGPADGVGLRPNVQGDLQKAEIDRTRFRGMLDYTRNLAIKDPTLFGIPGQIRRLGQEGVQLANGLAQTFGAPDINTAKSQALASLASNGVNPQLLSEMFDPNLPALQSASSLLVYQAASALAGQQGRSVTDKDLVVFRNIAGDPNSLFESQQSYLTRLQTMEDMVNILAKSDAQAGGRSAPAVTGGPAPAAAAPGGAPVPRAMQTPAGAVTIRRKE